MNQTNFSAPETVLRSALPRVSAVVVWIICAGLAVNFLVLGHAAALLAYLPWLAFVSWGTYVLSWRPCLRVGPDRLVVVNLLRDRVIPFRAVTDIRVTHSVVIKTKDAAFTSWGAPGLERFGPKIGDGGGVARSAVRGSGARSDTGSQAILTRAWSGWEQRQGDDAETLSAAAPVMTPVRTTWSRPALISGALVLAGCLADVLAHI
ncbi:PH domain-containing protein [Arthrobacter sp. H14-L1]|uniref:PH domain-containing protein n=1 Tax=Arthrobacter sp. H14-L1 TaxID=2996697 RepID=UPI002272072A|nr:PH domain-containing protein [Arthrobacter sp. H14-L1]MCY0905030.1 PH domain-containing protein [Arthrobacter sp. H14-L1]